MHLKYLILGIFSLTAPLAIVAARHSPPPAAQPTSPPQTQRVPQFENRNVRVWRSTVLPHAPLSMHHHDHPRVIVPLTSGTMDLVQQNGPAEHHLWEAGKAYWLPANAPGTQHADVNTGDKPIQLMVIEIEHEN